MTTEQENLKKQKFLDALYIPQKQGWDKRIVFCHAYLETGDFWHVPNYNYWGIKVKRGHWEHGENLKTYEYENGKLKLTTDDFALFGTEFQAMTFYCFWVKHTYPLAFADRDNYLKYFDAIQAGGWAEGNDHYATDLKDIFDRFKTRKI